MVDEHKPRAWLIEGKEHAAFVGLRARRRRPRFGVFAVFLTACSYTWTAEVYGDEEESGPEHEAFGSDALHEALFLSDDASERDVTPDGELESEGELQEEGDEGDTVFSDHSQQRRGDKKPAPPDYDDPPVDPGTARIEDYQPSGEEYLAQLVEPLKRRRRADEEGDGDPGDPDGDEEDENCSEDPDEEVFKQYVRHYYETRYWGAAQSILFHKIRGAHQFYCPGAVLATMLLKMEASVFRHDAKLRRG